MYACTSERMDESGLVFLSIGLSRMDYLFSLLLAVKKENLDVMKELLKNDADFTVVTSVRSLR